MNESESVNASWGASVQLSSEGIITRHLANSWGGVKHRNRITHVWLHQVAVLKPETGILGQSRDIPCWILTGPGNQDVTFNSSGPIHGECQCYSGLCCAPLFIKWNAGPRGRSCDGIKQHCLICFLEFNLLQLMCLWLIHPRHLFIHYLDVPNLDFVIPDLLVLEELPILWPYFNILHQIKLQFSSLIDDELTVVPSLTQLMCRGWIFFFTLDDELPTLADASAFSSPKRRQMGRVSPVIWDSVTHT